MEGIILQAIREKKQLGRKFWSVILRICQEKSRFSIEEVDGDVSGKCVFLIQSSRPPTLTSMLSHSFSLQGKGFYKN